MSSCITGWESLVRRTLKIEKCFYWSPGLGRARELQALTTATGRKPACWSMTKRLAAPVCQTKQWVFNRTKVKEVRNAARRRDKEKPLIYREIGSLLSCLYRGTLSHTLLTWPCTEVSFPLCVGLMLISCRSLVHMLHSAWLYFNPFLLYNPFILKMWKLQRWISSTTLLLLCNFSGMSKLLSPVLTFLMRNQHDPLF